MIRIKRLEPAEKNPFEEERKPYVIKSIMKKKRNLIIKKASKQIVSKVLKANNSNIMKKNKLK